MSKKLSSLKILTEEGATRKQLMALPTLSVDQVAFVLGISRGLAYTSVQANEIPSIRLGGRVLIPVPALKKLLGED